MKPSAMRRKQAVDAARLYAYGKIKEMHQDFDERQQRIFHKYVGVASAQKAYYDDLDNEMWQAYTGMTREEYFAYFPEDEKFFTPYEDALKTLVSQMVECYDSVKGIEDQKEFALAVKDKPFSAVLFQARKDGSDVVHKFHQQSESYKMKVLEGYV